MTSLLPEPRYEHGSAEHTAVLLINLGTPEAPTPLAVRRYLKEFLSDPRVVEIPRALWWPILNGIILNTRPKKSAEKYASIWTPDGSPLKVHCEKQTRLLRGLLGNTGHQVVVDYAMRYGRPSIASTLTRLKAEGCKRILLVPLYPQYSLSTTATALDAVYDWARTLRNQPEIRTVRSFADDTGYGQAGRKDVEASPDELLLPGDEFSRRSPIHTRERRSLPLRVPKDRQAAGRVAESRNGPVSDHVPIALRAH